MRTLSTLDPASKVRGMAAGAVDTLLRLKMTHDLVNHIVDARRTDWRGFVDELHVDYPIRGAGVIVRRDMLAVSETDAEDGGFMHGDEDVSPDEIVTELNDYPLEAASAAYAFSVVEVFGNEVANLRKPGTVRERGTWHENVRLDLGAPNDQQASAALQAFAKPFDGDPASVEPASVLRLVSIRQARNDYVHRRDRQIDFATFLPYCIAVISQILFLTDERASELKCFPWENYDPGKWS